MSYLLWKALYYPQPQHPIFRYAQQARPQSKALAWYWQIFYALLGFCLAVFVLLFPVPAFLSLLASLILVPALLLIFNGTVLGTYWITLIAERIAHERRNGRSDLLSLLPDGDFGVNWQLAMGVVHRNGYLQQSYRILRGTLLIVLVLLVFGLLLFTFGAAVATSAQERANHWRIFLDILLIGLVFLFFWADHIQSIIIAVLLALSLPYMQQEETLLKIIAPVSFLAIQSISYLFGFGLFFLGLATLEFIALPLLLFASLLLLSFCVYREIVIRALWYQLLQVSNSSAGETIVHF